MTIQTTGSVIRLLIGSRDTGKSRGRQKDTFHLSVSGLDSGDSARIECASSLHVPIYPSSSFSASLSLSLPLRSAPLIPLLSR